MTKLISAILALTATISSASAATVVCNFMDGDIYDQEFGWVGNPSEETLFRLFEEELQVNLDNALLAKLDDRQPFFVADHRLGKIYISGDDMGVEGKMVSADGDHITVWNGYCAITFG